MQTQDRKPYEIDKHLIWNAYKCIKKNKESVGIDGVEIEDYDKAQSLYTLEPLFHKDSYGSQCT